MSFYSNPNFFKKKVSILLLFVFNLLILCVLFQISCKSTEKKNTKFAEEQFDWSFLKQTWIFLEEDVKTLLREFRPKGYEFPPARGRDGYEFQENGELIYHGIGAADQPTEIKGKWELDTINQIIKISFYKNKLPSQRLEVKSLTKDVLKMKVVSE